LNKVVVGADYGDVILVSLGDGVFQCADGFQITEKEEFGDLAVAEGIEGGDHIGFEKSACFGGVGGIEAIGVPLVENFAGDLYAVEEEAGVIDHPAGDAFGERAMEDGVLVWLIPDECAVVINLPGVEVEEFINVADTAGWAGGGDDDFDAHRRKAFEGDGGLFADLLGIIEKRAVEIDGDQANFGGAIRIWGGVFQGGGFYGGGAGSGRLGKAYETR